MNPISLLIGFGTFGYGLYLSYNAWRHKQKIESSKAWPSTYGTVTKAIIESRNKGRGGRHHYAVVEYKYEVFGMPVNGKIKIERFWGTKGGAEEDAKLHPVGTSCGVRYNPNKPDEHVVDFDVVSGAEIGNAATTIIFGAIFLLTSILAVGGE